MRNSSDKPLQSKILSRIILLTLRWKLLPGVFALAIISAACSSPHPLPVGLTPIPTLIPATLPPSNIQPTEIPSRVIESYPVGLPSASTGQELYNEHCAECHGSDGNGLVPNARNFGDVDYMRGETPAEFYGIITEGRGPDMPAFGTELSSDERWALVYYIWRFSTTNDNLKTGSEIYVSSCASCHGEEGRSMILGAANFSDQRFLAHQPPSDLYVSVTQGQGSMPAFQARLNQDDRWAVIDYIRTFSYDPAVSDEAEVLEAETGESVPEEEVLEACGPYLLQSNPFDWDDTAAIADGEALYKSCSGCHGEDGKGRLPGILDFSDPTFQADLRDNAGKYLCSIAEGYNNMPSFKSTLDEEDMWKILVFMAAFGSQ